MNQPLPIGSIFSAALKLPLQHTRKLVFLGLPLLGMLMLFDYFMPETLNFDSGTLALIQQACIGVLTCLSLVIAVVGCHRLFLLENNQKPLFWSGNEFSYLIWWILMTIYMVLIMLPFALLLIPLTGFLESSYSGLIEVVIVVLNIPLYYLISRWSLLLPAVATGKRDVNIPWSWRLSKGNAWRLTLLIGLFPFTKEMVFAFVPETESLLFSFADNLLWLVIGVVEVGLLSLSYEFLIKNQQPEPETHNVDVAEPEQA